METAFFWLSKLVWFFISPEALFIASLLMGWVLLLRGKTRWGKRLLGASVVFLLLLVALPVGEWVLYPLETRFPANPELPEKIDGIIVLGGAEDAVRSAAWDQPEVNDSAERFLASVELARRFPGAKVLFTSGSGNPFDQKSRSVDVARKVYAQLGIPESRLVFEGESRNTAENIARSLTMVQPRAGEVWLLVTSAFHMPRSVGIFCKAGWPVIAFPVDHRSLKGNLFRFNGLPIGNLNLLSTGIKEWVGLAAYFASGRTDSFLSSGCPVARAR